MPAGDKTWLQALRNARAVQSTAGDSCLTTSWDLLAQCFLKSFRLLRRFLQPGKSCSTDSSAFFTSHSLGGLFGTRDVTLSDSEQNACFVAPENIGLLVRPCGPRKMMVLLVHLIAGASSCPSQTRTWVPGAAILRASMLATPASSSASILAQMRTSQVRTSSS